MADNFHVDITGAPLRKALEIAFMGAHGGKVRGWAVDSVEGRDRLILFWTDSEAATPLPVPLGVDQAVPFVEAWLADAEYGAEPDHDGHNTKGWRVYNETWGMVGRHRESFAAIEGAWLMHGK